MYYCSSAFFFSFFMGPGESGPCVVVSFVIASFGQGTNNGLSTCISFPCFVLIT